MSLFGNPRKLALPQGNMQRILVQYPWLYAIKSTWGSKYTVRFNELPRVPLHDEMRCLSGEHWFVVFGNGMYLEVKRVDREGRNAMVRIFNECPYQRHMLCCVRYDTNSGETEIWFPPRGQTMYEHFAAIESTLQHQRQAARSGGLFI